MRAWRGQVYGAVIDQQLHEGNVAGASALLTRVQGELDLPTANDLGGRIVLADAKIQDQRNAPVGVPDAGSDVGVGGGAIDSGSGGDMHGTAGTGVQVAQNVPQDNSVMSDAGMLPGTEYPQVAQQRSSVNPGKVPPIGSADDYEKVRSAFGKALLGQEATRINNIGDILHKDGRAGEGPPSRTRQNPRGFATFYSPLDGIKANVLTLVKNYPEWLKNEERNTKLKGKIGEDRKKLSRFSIANIVRLWDTDDEKIQNGWVKIVSAASGIGADAEIDPTNPDQIAALMYGMGIAERGRALLPRSFYLAGTRAALFNEPYPLFSVDEMRTSVRDLARQTTGIAPSDANRGRDLRPLVDEVSRAFFRRVDNKANRAKSDGADPGYLDDVTLQKDGAGGVPKRQRLSITCKGKST